MPPPAILDLSELDFSKVIIDRAEILRVNPQRHEFELLDGIVHCDRTTGIFAGYHDVRPDDWWVRGHIPGRPLFPGCLMIEVAAQLSSYMTHIYWGDGRFVGFAAADEVRFRGTVEPPARFVVVGKAKDVRRRRSVSVTQGFVNGVMVFEANITGMAV